MPQALLLGATLVTLLGALLSAPRWRTTGDERAPLGVVLLDVSSSVVGPRPSWLPWVRDVLADEAARAEIAGAELMVISYADGVAVLFGPGDPDRFSSRLEGVGGGRFDPLGGELEQGDTDLVGALRVAERELVSTARPAGRLTLVGSDGGGASEVTGLLAGLARAGVELAAVPPPPAELGDVALLDLWLPRDPPPGSPLIALGEIELGRSREVLNFELALDGERVAQLELVGPSEGGLWEVGRHRVELDFGRVPRTGGWVEWTHRAPRSDPDPCSDNDSLRRSLRVGGSRPVVVVREANDGAAVDAWISALGEPSGIEWRVCSPDRLASELPTADAVLAWDPDLSVLPVELLRSAVDEGLGLGVLQGFRALGSSAGFVESGLSALESRRDSRPSRDVILLVDGSGSMAGAAFDAVRTAAVELAAAVPTTDRLWLRFFTGVLFEPVSLDAGRAGRSQSRDRAAVAERVLGARAPSGPTALLASLEQLASERSLATNGDALVLLLTDGREEGDPIREEQRRVELVESFGATRTRLRALAVGDRVDLSTLTPLVTAPEHLIRVDDRAHLAELVVRTALSEDVARGPSSVTRSGGELARAVFGDTAEPSSWSIDRWLPSRALPGSEAAWVESEGSAVLGLARRGAGRIATVALLPEVDWAGGLAASQAPWIELVRWLSDHPRRRSLSARVVWGEVEGPLLVVDGLDAGTPATLRAVFDDGRNVLLDPPGTPGAHGTRQAPWPRSASDRAGRPVALWFPDLEGEPMRLVETPMAAENRPSEPLPPLPTADAGRFASDGRGPHPWAPAVLALGFVLATTSGIARVVGARSVKDGGAGGR